MDAASDPGLSVLPMTACGCGSFAVFCTYSIETASQVTQSLFGVEVPILVRP